MDIETFERFKNEVTSKGEKIPVIDLGLLNATERQMFLYIKENNYRLEQEKIRQDFSNSILLDKLGKCF